MKAPLITLRRPISLKRLPSLNLKIAKNLHDSIKADLSQGENCDQADPSIRRPKAASGEDICR